MRACLIANVSILILFLLFLIPGTLEGVAQPEGKRAGEGTASVVIKRGSGASDRLRANVRFCSDIEDKDCASPRNFFRAGEGKIYCHTTITGAGSYMEIKHLWYHGERLVQKVRLPVRSSRWRTWSIRSIGQKEPGAWRVEVYCGGLKIGEGSFNVTAEAQ